MKSKIIKNAFLLSLILPLNSYAVCFGGFFEIIGYGVTPQAAMYDAEEKAHSTDDNYNWVTRKSDYVYKQIFYAKFSATAKFQACSAW